MADEQKGTMAGDRDDAKAKPSEPKGDTPATVGKGETKVSSAVPERTEGHLNPSSPANTGTTPGSNAKVG